MSQTKEKLSLPTISHTETRPWGTFTTLEEGPGYKIKRIEVVRFVEVRNV